MKIFIDDNKTLAEIQREFGKEFPYLKIEFFETPHNKAKALPKSKMYPNARTVGSCRKVHNTGEISISKNELVEKLEQDFWDNFGLSVQVFRKSGTLWIETSLTDSWSLERQNREGHEISENKSAKEISDELDLTDRDKWD